MSFGDQRGHLRKYKGAGAATGNSPSIPSSLGLTSSRTFHHMRLTVDSSDLTRFVKRLDELNKRGAPHAIRDAINNMAFAGRKQWQREMQANLVLRTKYTAGKAIQVDKARGTNIDRMEARLGSVANYMAKVEFGERESARGSGPMSGVPVPTGYAAGQPGTRVPTRVVSAANRMRNITLRPGRGNRKQRNAKAMARAQASAKKFMVLEHKSGSKGIFRLTGSKKNPRPKLVWHLRRAVRMKPHPTLEPTVEKISRRAPRFYAAALSKQVRRALKS